MNGSMLRFFCESVMSVICLEHLLGDEIIDEVIEHLQVKLTDMWLM